MKMKIAACVMAVTFIFTGCSHKDENNNGMSGIDISSIQAGVNGENIPVSRGYAAKMSAFFCGSHSEIDLCDGYMNFNDVKESDWYGKYVNFCCKNGIVKGTEGGKFDPVKNLTLSEAQYFVNALDKSGEIQIHITEETKDKPLSLSLWNTIYEKLISASGNTDIKTEELSVFADSHLYGGLKENYVITDKGVYCCDGIDISSYENCRFKAYVKDNDIIAITEITDKRGYMENAYIKSVEDGSVNIYVNGVERKFKWNDNLFNEEMEGEICGFYFIDNEIEECSVYKDKISGTVKMADNEKCEISSAGVVKYDDDMKIYEKNAENIVSGDLKHLIPGRKCDFILDNGRIKAVVMEDGYVPSEIYVHIKNGAEDSFNNITIIKDGNEINVNKDELSERLIVEPGESKLKIKINGNDYEISGRIEAFNGEKGVYLINVREIEEYVSAVAAKKSDDTMNENMLDLMGVIARTEICYNLFENKYASKGASADNTNVASPDTKVTEAVKRTEGQVITYDNEIINPLYFSCSCGNTADNGEVWKNPRNGFFTWEGYNYLKPMGEDLSDNEVFAGFIENNDGKITDGWYRWEIDTDINVLSQEIKMKIGGMCEKYSDYIKVMDVDGIYRSRKITDIGDIKEIQVTKRGKGGNAAEICIKGSLENIKVGTMPAIAEILSSVYIVNKCDGTSENVNTLPSMFFEINNNEGKIIFKGGGMGHGVGMGISDARIMSESSTYKEIIEKFYKNTVLDKLIYE